MKARDLHYDLMTVSMLWRLLIEREGNKSHDLRCERLIDDVRELLCEVRDEILWDMVEALREENRDEKTNAIINMPAQQHS